MIAKFVPESDVAEGESLQLFLATTELEKLLEKANISTKEVAE